MVKTEQEIFEELYESIYSGNVDSDDSDDTSEEDESTEKDKHDKEDESTEKSESTDTDDEDVDDEDSDDEDSDDEDSDDEDSDEVGSDKGFGGNEIGTAKAGGAFKTQVKSLKKQYNELLIDSFEKYSTECIADALDKIDSAFGENISDILDLAMSILKDKIMGDLGIESSNDIESMPPAAMGVFDPDIASNTPMEISIEK